jgi:hypothetical protein
MKLVAYTDLHGTYALRGVLPGTYLLRAWKNGYQEATQVVDVYAAKTTPGDFTLEASETPDRGVVKGTVREADTAGAAGAPIAGALVAALPPDSVVNGFGDLASFFGGPEGDSGTADATAAAKQNAQPSIYTALTDENGEYRLKLPAGDYLLVAAKRGYIPQGQKATIAAAQELVVDFALRKEVQLLLRVEAKTDQPSYERYGHQHQRCAGHLNVRRV